MTNCTALLKIAMQRPISLQTHHILLQKRCGFDGSVPLVCCNESVEEYKSCSTPYNKPGTCKPFSSCPELIKLMRKRPLSADDKRVLRSQCDFRDGIYYACCPIINDSVQLPKPPVCGFQTDDYIIGGNKTNIDDHTWTAILKYKFSDILCAGSLISSRYVLTGKKFL